jgi:hypothetical protein
MLTSCDTGAERITHQYCSGRRYRDGKYFRPVENWTKEICRHFASFAFPRHETTVVKILTMLLAESASTELSDSAATVMLHLIPHLKDPQTSR